MALASRTPIDKTVVLSLILLLISSLAFAEIKLELKLPGSTLILGDEIVAELKIDGAQSDIRVLPPEVEGLRIRQMGPPSSTSQTVIINGKVSSFSGLVYRFGISAHKKGSYSAPPFSVEYKGKRFSSNKFQLRVKEQGEQNRMKLKLGLSKDKVYQQQPVEVTLKWYLQDSVEEYQIRLPLLDKKEELNLKLSDNKGAGSSVNLNVGSYQVPFLKTGEDLNGESYTVYQVSFVIYPNQVGEFDIQPASVKAMIQEGTELKRDLFGRVVRAPRLKQVFATTKATKLRVLELPENNRPSGFSGAVGRFQVSTTVNNTKVKVGDPIELSITITGEGRLEKIEQPVLSEMSQFSKGFAIVDSLQPGDIKDKMIEFKQVIRPRNHLVKKIPAVIFSFFDPVSETYKTIKSNEIPLQVLPTQQVKEEDIIINRESGTVTSMSFTRQESGIYANYLFEDALRSQSIHPAWWLLLLIPPFFYGGLFFGVARYRRLTEDASLARAKSAKNTKNKRLKKAEKLLQSDGDDYYFELSNALRGFIADRLNLGAGEVLSADVKVLAAKGKLPYQLSNETEIILDEIDRVRYSGLGNKPDERLDLLQRVRKLMRNLSKEI